MVEETGKSESLAVGETDAAIEMGLFVAGEGRRSYGRTTTASMPHRTVMTLRQPLGVAALIMSFNTRFRTWPGRRFLRSSAGTPRS